MEAIGLTVSAEESSTLTPATPDSSLQPSNTAGVTADMGASPGTTGIMSLGGTTMGAGPDAEAGSGSC